MARGNWLNKIRTAFGKSFDRDINEADNRDAKRKVRESLQYVIEQNEYPDDHRDRVMVAQQCDHILNDIKCPVSDEFCRKLKDYEKTDPRSYGMNPMQDTTTGRGIGMIKNYLQNPASYNTYKSEMKAYYAATDVRNGNDFSIDTLPDKVLDAERLTSMDRLMYESRYNLTSYKDTSVHGSPTKLDENLRKACIYIAMQNNSNTPDNIHEQKAYIREMLDGSIFDLKNCSKSMSKLKGNNFVPARLSASTIIGLYMNDNTRDAVVSKYMKNGYVENNIYDTINCLDRQIDPESTRNFSQKYFEEFDDKFGNDKNSISKFNFGKTDYVEHPFGKEALTREERVAGSDKAPSTRSADFQKKCRSVLSETELDLRSPRSYVIEDIRGSSVRMAAKQTVEIEVPDSDLSY